MKTIRAFFLSCLLSLSMLAGQAAASDWTNPVEPLDVDDNGFIEMSDAAAIYLELITVGPHALDPAIDYPPPPYFDVDSDGDVDTLDMLFVINWIIENS